MCKVYICAAKLGLNILTAKNTRKKMHTQPLKVQMRGFFVYSTRQKGTVWVSADMNLATTHTRVPYFYLLLLWKQGITLITNNYYRITIASRYIY